MVTRIAALVIGLGLFASCGDKLDPRSPSNIQDAQNLLQRLRTESFESWAVAPGWDPPIQSTPGQHSGTAEVLMNPTLEAALGMSGLSAWPVDSIAVKNILEGPGGASSLLAIAQKRSDNEWFFVTIDPTTDAVFEATTGGACASCHPLGSIDALLSISLP